MVQSMFEFKVKKYNSIVMQLARKPTCYNSG